MTDMMLMNILTREGGVKIDDKDIQEDEVTLLNDYSVSKYPVNERLNHFMGCHITDKNCIAAEYVFMFEAYS